MPTSAAPSLQFEASFKCFVKYLVDLHKLTTFDSVSKAEENAHERIEIGSEEMDAGERQVVMLMQQVIEIYARDRQMQITGGNPFEVIIELDVAEVKNGYVS